MVAAQDACDDGFEEDDRVTPSDKSPVTIADVARVAGVAPSTVSRVLNNSPRASPAACERVMQAVEETGFVVNRRGRALAVGRSEAVALLFTDPFEELFSDPTYASICHGIVSRLSGGPNLPMILEAANPAERARVLEHVERRAVDAIIAITPYAGEEMFDGLRDMGVPVVLCGRLEGEPYRDVFSCVYSDDVDGAALAAQALVDAGQRDVVCVMGPADNPASVDRIRGYRRVLGDRLGEGCVVHTEWDRLGGYTAMCELLEAGVGVDAVLAGSDRIATGVIEALRGAGRDVPGDVSVVGFDDHPLAADHEPGITTVHQPLREEGEKAAELALAMIDGAAPRTVVMRMHLVERDSVRPGAGATTS